ncbi:MAG TPA: YbjN domain-containing protein, partial [Trichocoleus sp.]
ASISLKGQLQNSGISQLHIGPVSLTTDHCHTLPLDCPIALSITAGEQGGIFNAIARQLILIRNPNLQDCHLILSVTLEQYQQILDQALFHLKPEVRGPLQQTNFVPDQPILLELGLQPHLLTQAKLDLAEREDANTVLIAHLLATSPESVDVPIWLQTESWLCRSVQQQQANQSVSYTTLWAYTTPEQTEPVMASGSAALEAITTLLQKTADAVKAEVEPALPHLKQSLSQFSDELVAALDQVDWDKVLSSGQEEPEAAAPPISEVVKQFFDEDDWAYVQLADAAILQLAFQGDAGRWTCLAQSDDQAQQVVFYSVCTMGVPEEQYGAIAEFLTRANDGLIIGNFELSFDTGEVRYKTSLDVEGDRLTPALVKSLAHTNVRTFDLYLPGLIAVLEGRCTPAAGITRVEQSELNEKGALV